MFCITGGCSYINKQMGYEDDKNPVEEISEVILEKYFELPSGSIDLTPSSRE